MTILEKVTLQKQDTSKIFLFKEGIFYKAYNEGAFLLKDRDYKVAVKKIKGIENEVLSIGFPVSILNRIVENGVSEEVHENYVSFQTHIVFSNKSYHQWRSNLTAIEKNKANLSNNKCDYSALIDSIKNYPLANKTPIEVFNWVSELQKNIISL